MCEVCDRAQVEIDDLIAKFDRAWSTHHADRAPTAPANRRAAAAMTVAQYAFLVAVQAVGPAKSLLALSQMVGAVLGTRTEVVGLNPHEQRQRH
jgi:hypothetical protein